MDDLTELVLILVVALTAVAGVTVIVKALWF